MLRASPRGSPDSDAEVLPGRVKDIFICHDIMFDISGSLTGADGIVSDLVFLGLISDQFSFLPESETSAR